VQPGTVGPDGQPLLGPGVARRTLEGPGIGRADNVTVDDVRRLRAEADAAEVAQAPQPSGVRKASSTTGSTQGSREFRPVGSKPAPFELPDGEKVPAGFARLKPKAGVADRTVAGYTDPQGRFNAKSIKVGKGHRWSLTDNGNVVRTFRTLKEAQAEVNTIIQREINERAGIRPSDFDDSIPTVDNVSPLEALREVREFLGEGVGPEARINLITEGIEGQRTLSEAVDDLVDVLEAQLPTLEGGSGKAAQDIVDNSAAHRARLEKDMTAAADTDVNAQGVGSFDIAPINIRVDDTIPDDLDFFSGLLSQDGKFISSTYQRTEGGLGTEIHDTLRQQLGYTQALPSERTQATLDDGLIRISRPGRDFGMEGANWEDVVKVANKLLDDGLSPETVLSYDVQAGKRGLPGAFRNLRIAGGFDVNSGSANLAEITDYTRSIKPPTKTTGVAGEISDMVDAPASPNTPGAVRTADGELVTSRNIHNDPKVDPCN